MAGDLWLLVRKIGNKIIKAVITETEAYIGEDDLACHGSEGRTPRILKSCIVQAAMLILHDLWRISLC